MTAAARFDACEEDVRRPVLGLRRGLDEDCRKPARCQPSEPLVLAEPEVAGGPWCGAGPGPEYNLNIDIKAAQVVFNDSSISLWQVPATHTGRRW
jgi:hypothetical protein